MPTLEHGSLIEMFRKNPDIAPHFIETLFGLQVPAYASIGVVESTLDQMIPVEFRADLVIELRSVATRTWVGPAAPRAPCREPPDRGCRRTRLRSRERPTPATRREDGGGRARWSEPRARPPGHLSGPPTSASPPWRRHPPPPSKP